MQFRRFSATILTGSNTENIKDESSLGFVLNRRKTMSIGNNSCFKSNVAFATYERFLIFFFTPPNSCESTKLMEPFDWGSLGTITQSETHQHVAACENTAMSKILNE